MKGMISVREQLQRCALAKFLAKRLNLIKRRQSVARSLQEQHRDLYVEQMRGALLRWATGRMQRKS